MNLPQIQPVTLVKARLCGTVLQFRKAKLEDSAYLEQIVNEGVLGMESNIRILAFLMEGYEEPLEERIKFLKSLQVNGISDYKEITELLEKVGLNVESKKK